MLTKGDPQLPEHDERASDPSRGQFGREDGHGGVLGADTNTENESNSEQGLPRVGEARGYRGGEEDEGCEENLATTSKEVIQGVDDPCTAEIRER